MMTNNEPQPSPANVAAPSTTQEVALASASNSAERETQNPKPSTNAALGASPLATSHPPLATSPAATEPPTHRSTEAPLPASAESPVVCGPLSSGPSPLPGESPRAFEAFCAYLELGPSRRYVTVARKLGVTFRTVQRWAAQFDWRNRIIARAASSAGQFVQAQDADLADATAREKSVRERQFLLSEAVLELVERYFERMEDLDLEQVRFVDACRALEFASRLATQARQSEPADPDTGLRDQLTALLDQAFREMPKPTTP